LLLLVPLERVDAWPPAAAAAAADDDDDDDDGAPSALVFNGTKVSKPAAPAPVLPAASSCDLLVTKEEGAGRERTRM
jgi:hypothetical protein